MYLLNSVLKMKNRIVNGYRMTVSALVVYPCDPVSVWPGALSHCNCPASWDVQPWKKIKIQSTLSTESVSFSAVVKSKSYESNHHKLGTVGINNADMNIIEHTSLCSCVSVSEECSLCSSFVGKRNVCIFDAIKIDIHRGCINLYLYYHSNRTFSSYSPVKILLIFLPFS